MSSHAGVVAHVGCGVAQSVVDDTFGVNSVADDGHGAVGCVASPTSGVGGKKSTFSLLSLPGGMQSLELQIHSTLSGQSQFLVFELNNRPVGHDFSSGLPPLHIKKV